MPNPNPNLTPRFLDKLRVEEYDSKNWILISEFRYVSAVFYDSRKPEARGGLIVVPDGFITDFSSVPRIPFAFWLAGDTGRKAGVIHDFLYDHHLGGRQPADEVFLEALRAEDVSRWRAQQMFLGVRFFGGSHW